MNKSFYIISLVLFNMIFSSYSFSGLFGKSKKGKVHPEQQKKEKEEAPINEFSNPLFNQYSDDSDSDSDSDLDAYSFSGLFGKSKKGKVDPEQQQKEEEAPINEFSNPLFNQYSDDSESDASSLCVEEDLEEAELLKNYEDFHKIFGKKTSSHVLEMPVLNQNENEGPVYFESNISGKNICEILGYKNVVESKTVTTSLDSEVHVLLSNGEFGLSKNIVFQVVCLN